MIPEHIFFLHVLGKYRHTSARSSTCLEVPAFNKEAASTLLTLVSSQDAKNTAVSF